MEMSEAIAELHCYLKRTNRRYSIERDRLIEAVYTLPECFSLQELLDFIRAYKNVHALSTLYRNLTLLVDSGILTEYRNPSGRPCYRRGNHAILLVCTCCGRAMAAAMLPGQDEHEYRLAEEHDFEPLVSHRVIRGLCADCRKPVAS